MYACSIISLYRKSLLYFTKILSSLSCN